MNGCVGGATPGLTRPHPLLTQARHLLQGRYLFVLKIQFRVAGLPGLINHFTHCFGHFDAQVITSTASPSSAAGHTYQHYLQ